MIDTEDRRSNERPSTSVERGPKRWIAIAQRLLSEKGRSACGSDRAARTSARLALLAAAEYDKSQPALSLELGALMEEAGDFKAAGRAYLRAAGSEPDFAAACDRISKMYVRLGYAPLLAWVEDCLKTFEARTSSKIVIYLAHRLVAAGRPSWALRVLEGLISRYPEDHRAQSRLALARLRCGMVESSLEAAQRAAALAPASARAYLILGLTSQASRLHTEAVAAYEKCIALEPQGKAGLRAAIQLKRLHARPERLRDGSSGPENTGRLSGDLSVLPVPDLLQLLKLQSSTGELRLTGGSKAVRMCIEHGDITGTNDADGREVNVADGVEALVKMVGSTVLWLDGRFDFISGEPTQNRGRGVDPRLLLLEAFQTEDSVGTPVGPKMDAPCAGEPDPEEVLDKVKTAPLRVVGPAPNGSSSGQRGAALPPGPRS